VRTGILVGKGQRPVVLDLRYANRHGLIAGATGTGKTVSMQVMAEGFARQGIPVVLSDVKGDLTGMAFPGRPHPEVDRRVQHVGIQDFRFEGVPVVPWDVLGEEGHPLRATVSDLGPLLLARLLDLNATQTSVLEVAFALADDEGLLLLDLKDLRALLQYMGDQRRRLQETYGMLHPSTLAALQRRLLNLEREGGDRFFGEPALDIQDWLKPLPGGQAPVHLLVARRLLEQPRLYATFLLWLLSELFEELPEAGDTERPRMVFFFDEAHLLFDGAPRALVEKVEQVVKLIRSRGVGLFFVTQNPLDLPEGVLAQLGNRVQHALRAYTPRERRAVRAAARSFRENPAMDTEAVITQLAVGEALVSFLEEGGVPGVVERALIAPPRSRIGAATPEEWNRVLARSPFRGVYDTPVDRVSAYERLQMRATRTSTRIPERTPRRSPAPRRRSRRASTRRSSRRRRQSAGEAFLKSMLRGVGYTLGRRIVRGILGSILRGR
jgi:DNA helicase HerA-like ATPase